MFFFVSVLILIAGYIFLETFFHSRHVKVTLVDRIVGGAGGVVLLTGLYLFLNNRGELGQPESYVIVIVSMAVAIVLGVAAWLSITRGIE